MQKISKVVVFLVFMAFFACSKDSVDPVDTSCGTSLSFKNDIKSIIDNTCAYSGCHDGSGAAPGNYTTFEGFSNVLVNGQFENRALIARNMPPDFATEGPTELTESQLSLLTEWFNAGFPEEESLGSITYESSIRSIIDNSCAYSGCHDGQTSGVGDYNFFPEIQDDITSGSFFTRVVEIRDDEQNGMPPARAVDYGGSPRLNDVEFQLMLCWIENGYPEN